MRLRVAYNNSRGYQWGVAGTTFLNLSRLLMQRLRKMRMCSSVFIHERINIHSVSGRKTRHCGMIL